ncbi:MAG: TonB-dependent receptor [Gammaproteobacteria bacterium]|nr:TonB-dependent receptor [Gammaproteobacteria bacterium]
MSGFDTPYDEEEVEVWEFGLKSEWLDNRVRLNAALFTNDYTDMQIAQFEAGAGGASSRQVNAGAATYEGPGARTRRRAGGGADAGRELRLPRHRVRRVHAAQPGHEPAGEHLGYRRGDLRAREYLERGRAVRLRAFQFRYAVGAARRDLSRQPGIPSVPERSHGRGRLHAGQRPHQPQRHRSGQLLRQGSDARLAVGQEPRRRGVPQLRHRLRQHRLRGQPLRLAAHLWSRRGICTVAICCPPDRSSGREAALFGHHPFAADPAAQPRQ